MPRTVYVTNIICRQCRAPMGERVQETMGIAADSGDKGRTVVREQLSLCDKCQPSFRAEMDEAKKMGKLKVIPPGVGKLDIERLARTATKKKQEKKRGSA